MSSTNGMRGTNAGVRGPGRPASADELRKTRSPFPLASYTNEARKRLVKMQPRPWQPPRGTVAGAVASP